MRGASLKKKGDWKLSRKMLFMGGMVTAVFLYLAVLPPPLAKTLENAGYDEMSRFLGEPLSVPEVVIIDVDEQSLATLGQWPWPRYRIAALIEKTAQLGARSIAVDFLFPEPDRLSPAKFGALYQKEQGISLNLSGGESDAFDNDRILAETIARSPVVLGGDLVFEGDTRNAPEWCGATLNVVVRGTSGAEGKPPVPEASSTVCPLPELAEAAKFVAAVNPLPDDDGKVRRAPLLMRSGERWIPGLALCAVLTATGEKQIVLEWSPAGVISVRVGKIVIPTDRQGNILLPFRAKPMARFRHLSAADLIEGKIEAATLRDKIVFLGSSASGLFDAHPTPNQRTCPGVDIHALTADAILRGDFLVEPGWGLGVRVLTVLCCGMLVTVLMMWAPVTVGALVAGAAATLLTLGSWLLFDRQGIHLSPVPGLNTLIFGGALLMLMRLRGEEKRVFEQTRRLAEAQDCALLGLVSIAETRDPETGRHIVRTQHFVKILADYLSRLPKFKERLRQDDIDAIYKSAPLHDAGKVGVPDNILLKPGKLTDEEYEIMKQHTVRGYEVLKRSEEMAGVSKDMSFLRYAKEVARSHHEKWDGSGYPDGLKGEEIPISARLMALADVYDALRAKRVYKPQMPHEKARAIICEGKGAHFDPDVVDAFLAKERAFQDILEKYADTEEVPGRD